MPLFQNGKDEDMLIADAVKLICAMRRISVTMLQRHLRLGYSRAVCLMGKLEEKSVIGPQNLPNERKILIDLDDAGILHSLIDTQSELHHDTLHET
jgi:DNA segregation ATPase FtsK/SpoIIIE and related proteins